MSDLGSSSECDEKSSWGFAERSDIVWLIFDWIAWAAILGINKMGAEVEAVRPAMWLFQ